MKNKHNIFNKYSKFFINFEYDITKIYLIQMGQVLFQICLQKKNIYIYLSKIFKIFWSVFIRKVLNYIYISNIFAAWVVSKSVLGLKQDRMKPNLLRRKVIHPFRCAVRVC